ncbi:MAG: hypothetical protein MZV49_07725 [Rhodopseudomonas palustris]|nr:hypothetical protein [Rhodopseudomonas palustris]
MRLLATVAALAVAMFPTAAMPACGDRGGPGYRGPTGKCVGWAEFSRVCGNPPEKRVRGERTCRSAATAGSRQAGEPVTTRSTSR